MDELTYRFTRSQLQKLLDQTIGMMIEWRDIHSRDEISASRHAVAEMLDGLDADRELAATDGHERLRLQLPPAPHRLLAEADASAESYEGNGEALSR